MNSNTHKEPTTYLGDGAYAEYDGYSIWIYTSNGEEETNRICLEPNVYENLVDFVALCVSDKKRKEDKKNDGPMKI